MIIKQILYCSITAAAQAQPGEEPMEQQTLADQTTLVPNEEDAFALEPIDISGKLPHRKRILEKSSDFVLLW